ncbi:helix-turn-helix domain-containing protein [Pantoea ananatis]|uniref:helix-turn-helix domain-containing protein n=1 Tax=Pantoea ananas TaxID=553 RepID=UPI001FF0C846|nr:AraC family transcriptional regulator [Pantoea ananatis]
MFLIYAGYGIALLRAATNGADFFVESHFREASITQKMTFFAGCFLCFSALTDAVISRMMNIAPQLIALFQGMTLPLLCIAIVRAVKSVPAGETHAEETSSLTDDEAKDATLEPLCLHIENLVRAHAYYLDTDLTLNKLARKLDIPARHISRAVNATRQCNVSQWLNGFRIEKAQDMLRQPQLKITDIMLETGFISKSNFNREFMRITGKTPTAFRQAMDDSAARC